MTDLSEKLMPQAAGVWLPKGLKLWEPQVYGISLCEAEAVDQLVQPRYSLTWELVKMHPSTMERPFNSA